MGRVIFLTNFKSVDDLIKALDPPAAVDALAGRAGAHLAPLGLGLVAVRLHLRLERGLEDVANLNMVVRRMMERVIIIWLMIVMMRVIIKIMVMILLTRGVVTA